MCDRRCYQPEGPPLDKNNPPQSGSGLLLGKKTPSTKLIIETTGNVGLYTTDPGLKIEVPGAIYIDFTKQETTYLYEMITKILHRFLITGEAPGVLYHELPPERFHKEVRKKVLVLQRIAEKLWCLHNLSS